MEKQWIGGRKMFAQEDFIPGLVHKLNTHLAPLIAYGQLLLPKVGDRESKRYVEKIIEETQQAFQLTKDLLNFAKRRNPKKEVVDLNRLIEKVLETKIPRLNFKNIEVVKDLSVSIPRTLVDPKQIEQALINLIANAEEAISEFHGFGKIDIKTRLVEGQIEIIITDDGPGISNKDMPRIFDPLFTTKGEGSGLGLSVSNDIIIEHDGEIRVEREWGKATSFIIAFPVIEVEYEKEPKGNERINHS